MPIQSLIASVGGVVPSNGDYDLVYIAQQLNPLVKYDRIVVVNRTSSATRVYVGLKYGNHEYILQSFNNLAVGECGIVSSPFYAPGHYVPFARFVSALQGDRVFMYLYGYVEIAKKGE